MSTILPPLRLVTFDALYTIIAPRLPIHVQYSEAFAPHIGVLDPESIRQSFRTGKIDYVSEIQQFLEFVS